MSTSVIESNGKASTETVIPNAKDTLANVLYGGANQGDGPAPTNPSTEKPASTSENGTQSTSDKTVTASSTVEQSETKEPPKGKAEPTELEKQLKSQSDANRRLGQELRDSKDQLDRALEAVKMLQAKIDGTYEEPAQPTPEQIKAQADFSGREVASARMAVERYGADAVKAAIYTEKGVKSKIEELKAEKKVRVEGYRSKPVQAEAMTQEAEAAPVEKKAPAKKAPAKKAAAKKTRTKKSEE